MTTLRHLALAAAVFAGSAAILASPASANTGILDRLADMEARGTSRESHISRSPLAERNEKWRGIEIAGDPVMTSADRNDSGIINRLGDLQARGTSRENQIPRSPLEERNELWRGVEIAGTPSAVAVQRDQGTIVNRLHDLSSTSRENSIRY